MDWFIWIIFGIVLIALVARVLVGPSGQQPDDPQSDVEEPDPADFPD